MSTENNGWFLTDSDCCQYARKNDGLYRSYDFVQITGAGDMFYVYVDCVDLESYPEEDILYAINAYGYESIEDVISTYGDDAYQIIAECIFETNVGEGVCSCLMKSSSYEECERYIKERVI